MNDRILNCGIGREDDCKLRMRRIDGGHAVAIGRRFGWHTIERLDNNCGIVGSEMCPAPRSGELVAFPKGPLVLCHIKKMCS